VFGGAATTAVQLAAAAAPADSGTVMPGTPRCHTSQLAAAFTGASSVMLHKGVTLVLTNESDRTEHHASAWSPRRTGNVGGWNATSATAQRQLAGLASKLGLAAQALEHDDAQTKALLNQVTSHTAQALKDLRELARGIYPTLLAGMGVAAARSAQVSGGPHISTVPDRSVINRRQGNRRGLW
jgi:Histidine kinase